MPRSAINGDTLQRKKKIQIPMQVSDLAQEQTAVRDTCCASLGWLEEEG